MCIRDREQIGAYIAARRKAVGLTQAELGERLGITAQSVSNWERGETMPDTGLLQDLALILDTSADELLGAGSCGWRYRRRVTVERMSEAISCIQRLRELLGEDHFMYRTMIDALDVYKRQVWPISLSARLPIVGLVGRYPSNYLMGREPLSKR